MSTTCIDQVALECTTGGSDKLYVIQVQESVTAAGKEYATICYYGKRGSTLTATTKYTGASLGSARAAANKMEAEKRGKGYVNHLVASGTAVRGMPSSAPVFGGAAAPSPMTPVAAAAAAAVGPMPMLAATISTEADLEKYLKDSDAMLQRKYDGERAIVSLRRSGIVCTNRKGVVRPLTGGAEAELKKLLVLPDFSDDRETVLDGELMGEEFIAYDILTLRDNDMRQVACDERYFALEALLDINLGLLAESAWSEEEKRAMYARALKEGWEGVMVRIGASEYTAGRCNWLLKFKLWATATCRVLTVNTKRSIQLALRDDKDDEVFVGNVTVPVNQDLPEVYSLVEVRYLYAMEGGSLYQPTLIGPRHDLDDCDTRASLRAAPPEKRKPAESAGAEEEAPATAEA